MQNLLCGRAGAVHWEKKKKEKVRAGQNALCCLLLGTDYC